MSISKKFYNSFTELKSVKSLAMIAMLLALRIILGFTGNSTLPFFGNNVKLSGAFLPIAITGSMFGPVPAMIVGMLGDLLVWHFFGQVIFHLPFSKTYQSGC